MSLILTQQTPNQITWLDAANPDLKFQLKAERVNSKVKGFRANTFRANILLAVPVALNFGCTEGCIAPEYQPRITRLMLSGPVSDKAAVIADLEFILNELKTENYDNVFEGYPPTSIAAPVYPPVGG